MQPDLTDKSAQFIEQTPADKLADEATLFEPRIAASSELAVVTSDKVRPSRKESRLQALARLFCCASKSRRRRSRVEQVTVDHVLRRSQTETIRLDWRVPENSNKVSQYRWVEELLATIISGVDVADTDNFTGSPLFVVMGACPYYWAPMQAVLFAEIDTGSLDFWWVKPQKDGRLDRETLKLCTRGAHKNVPESSRPVYQPLVDKFLGQTDGHFTFFVSDHRAVISDARGGREMLVYMIWVESWGGAFFGNRFIKGKICYQKRGETELYARQYSFQENRLIIALDEESVPLMPPDSFQAMYEMADPSSWPR